MVGEKITQILGFLASTPNQLQENPGKISAAEGFNHV